LVPSATVTFPVNPLAVFPWASRTVTWAGESVGFDIDDYTRWRLMEGLDDVDLTLRHGDAVADFESRRPHWMPTTA